MNVSTEDGNAVIIGEEEYRGLMETLYLTSIPGMTKSIQDAAAEPLEEGVNARELDWF